MNMRKTIQALVAVILLSSLTVQFDWDRASINLTVAQAQVVGELTIRWTPPTEYTDGFPLLEQDLEFYTFYCGGNEIVSFLSIIGNTSYVVDTSGMPSGTHSCTLSVTTLAGIESAQSNTINFTIGARTPGNPVGLTTL